MPLCHSRCRCSSSTVAHCISVICNVAFSTDLLCFTFFACPSAQYLQHASTSDHLFITSCNNKHQNSFQVLAERKQQCIQLPAVAAGQLRHLLPSAVDIGPWAGTAAWQVGPASLLGTHTQLLLDPVKGLHHPERGLRSKGADLTTAVKLCTITAMLPKLLQSHQASSRSPDCCRLYVGRRGKLVREPLEGRLSKVWQGELQVMRGRAGGGRGW